MTKNVRIENADTSPHRLRVEVYETANGQPLLVDKRDLLHPTAMAEIAIHSDRYIKVIEIPVVNSEVEPGMP